MRRQLARHQLFAAVSQHTTTSCPMDVGAGSASWGPRPLLLPVFTMGECCMHTLSVPLCVCTCVFRCTLEANVSTQLIMALQGYKKIEAALATLPSKVLALSSDADAVDATPTVLGDLDEHMARVAEDIRNATFSSNTDEKENVVSLFRDYVERIGNVLARSVAFIEEVKGVPVLLSILVLIFRHRDAGSSEPLPTNRFELYEMATRLAVQQQAESSAELTRSMLSMIAKDNHIEGDRREFTMVQGEQALVKDIKASKQWRLLLRSEDGVPLIKTLVGART